MGLTRSLGWTSPRRWPAAVSLAPCRPASTAWEPASLPAPASLAPLTPALGVLSLPNPPSSLQQAEMMGSGSPPLTQSRRAAAASWLDCENTRAEM